jgi:hypothetical protein
MYTTCSATPRPFVRAKAREAADAERAKMVEQMEEQKRAFEEERRKMEEAKQKMLTRGA